MSHMESDLLYLSRKHGVEMCISNSSAKSPKTIVTCVSDVLINPYNIIWPIAIDIIQVRVGEPILLLCVSMH